MVTSCMVGPKVGRNGFMEAWPAADSAGAEPPFKP